MAPVTYEVNGVVSYQDKPIAEGSITFEDSETGVADAFPIGKDGAYTAQLPEGTFGVSIQPPMESVADSANSEGGDQFKRVDYIPTRYWSAYESKLKVDVSGDTSFDVNMTQGRR